MRKTNKACCICAMVTLLFSAAPAIAGMLDVADSPVTLADARSFDAPAESPEITLAEITAARQRLASAVSAEKFIDGAEAVLLVVILLTALAP